MKKPTFSLERFAQPLRKVAAHYSFISVILALLTLIYCVYTIQQLFNAPNDTAYRQEQVQKTTKTTFDQKTIDRIEQLRTTSDTPENLPAGRINPFVE